MDRRVDLSAVAQRSLRRLPAAEVERLYARLTALGREPFPRGAVKLKGKDAEFRIRVGDYRILYRIDDSQRRVLIVHIGHRRDVYR
jgi:mRNA interferase RelE/StbE